MGRSRLLSRIIVTALVLGGLGSLVSLAGAPAGAANPVITFDDLGLASGGRTTVNTQYAAQGVTFNDVTAIDYSQPPYPAGFAHSGTVAIEQCFAVEFCNTPIVATFTSAQRFVKLWVGFSQSLSQPLDVRLTAFDANHQSLGSADVTLPASSFATPIQNPLEVSVNHPAIQSIEVAVPGSDTNFVAVDDLEFSSAGPPPPCDATSVPTVLLTQPPNSSVVQGNSFPLQGTVDTGGAPIESASITAVGAQTRKADVFPTLIRSGGGDFGPVSFNELLNQGTNKVFVTATNCLGSGTSQEVIVVWNPIPPDASIRMLGLEVTQAVQDPNNSVPLIAATCLARFQARARIPGPVLPSPCTFKRTFVRVYLSVSGVSEVTQVSGTLTASRPDGSRPGGPASIPSLNTITVEASAPQGTFENARDSLTKSLNFELPLQWLGAGQLHLQLGSLSIEGQTSSLPCQFCDNPGALPNQPQSPPFVTFHTVPPLRIFLVGVPYMVPQGPGLPLKQVAPRQLDFDMLASWLKRAYPSADVQITQASLAPLQSPPTSCDQVNALLSQFVAMSGQDPRTRFYGLIPDNNQQNFVGGCSVIGGQYGSGAAGPVFPEANAWDLDGSYADAYGAHEIAHMYGREHPGFCGQRADDPNYPFPGGALGDSASDFQGFDTGDASLGLPVSLDDWRAGWSDLMTYCHFQWMSSYTYEGILQNLCAADATNCPDHAVLGARARHVVVEQPRSDRLALAVTGTLALATGKVALEPLMVRPGLTLTAAEPDGAYAIELRDAAGNVLSRHPFQPQEESDPPTPSAARALINEVVSFPARTKQIAVMHGTHTLVTVPVSAHTPTVHVISPNGGTPRGSRITVRWRAHDADRNRLWYTVLYAPDGRQFLPVATKLTRHSLQVDLTTLPGGASARFEVIATDGVRTGSDVSDRPLNVPVKPPRVSISAPADKAELDEGQSITLVGTASDLQDTVLQASQLVWSSSLQGELGAGPSVTVTLQPGTHLITLTATNSEGVSSATTITVIVHKTPPVLVASIVP